MLWVNFIVYRPNMGEGYLCNRSYETDPSRPSTMWSSDHIPWVQVSRFALKQFHAVETSMISQIEPALFGLRETCFRGRFWAWPPFKASRAPLTKVHV